MKTWCLYTIILSVFGILISTTLQGQSIDNQKIVEQVYEVLQDRSATSQDIAVLMPVKKWNEIINSKQENERHKISLYGIMNREWRSIVFEKLKIQTPEKNKVLVSGIVKGRKPTECDYIFNQFQHFWFLKDGKIVDFEE